jgi:hypothetical protein
MVYNLKESKILAGLDEELFGIWFGEVHNRDRWKK